LICLAASIVSAQTAADLIDAGHFKRARPVVEARLKSNPNDAEANYNMARVQRAFGDKDGALKSVEKAIELDANKAPYHALLAELIGDAASNASMFKALGMARQVRKELDTALTLDPKNFEAITVSMMYYLKAPSIAGGDKTKAHAMAEEAMKVNSSRGYLAKVRLANEEKTTDQVEGFLRKAVEADPKYYPARASLANFLLNNKQFDEAEKQAREMLRMDPGRAFGYVALAHLYAAQNKPAELEAILQQAVKNVPDDLSPYYRAGRVLLANGSDLPRAEQFFRKYLSQDPEGNQPQLPFAHWSLGLVFEKMGRKSDAVTEIAECVKAKPEFEAAKKDLARVKQ
jgi:tetratricopeptide (TPR) repeat protein